MSKPMAALDRWRQILNLVFALTQIIAGYAFTLFHFGRPLSASAAVAPTPLLPAGYAFSIWGLIFLFALAYAIDQVRPRQEDNHLYRRLGWYTAGAFFFSTVWELVAQFWTFGWPTFFVIVIILAFSLAALFALPDYAALRPRERWLSFVPVSALAGWISAAAFVNLSSVLAQVRFNNFGLSLSAFSLLLLIIAGLFAIFILYYANGNFLYSLSVAWALVAILVTNLTQAYNPVMAFAAAVFAVIILIEILVLQYD